jgi:hypothetical protein
MTSLLTAFMRLWDDFLECLAPDRKWKSRVESDTEEGRWQEESLISRLTMHDELIEQQYRLCAHIRDERRRISDEMHRIAQEQERIAQEQGRL